MSIQEISGKITGKAVAKHALLPGIIPRLRRMGLRLGHFLHLFTTVLGMAGLIPRNHPVLRDENIGRYRFSDILGLAYSNLKWDIQHIPQIAMFGAVISAITLSIATLIAAFFTVVLGSAQAYAQFWGLPDPASGYDVDQDLAFEYLGSVFGDVGLEVWGGNPDPQGLVVMLKAMLRVYSQALMVIAVVMILYLMVNNIVEAARTGKPFGENFNGIWGPIRLALGIGLLVPFAGGGSYNGAQLIVFQASHWGSNLASNVWSEGLYSLDQEYFKGSSFTEPYDLMRGMTLTHICEALVESTISNEVLYAVDYEETYSDDLMARRQAGYLSAPQFCGAYDVPSTDPIDSITETQYTIPILDFLNSISKAYRSWMSYYQGAYTLGINCDDEDNGAAPNAQDCFQNGLLDQLDNAIRLDFGENTDDFTKYANDNSLLKKIHLPAMVHFWNLFGYCPWGDIDYTGVYDVHPDCTIQKNGKTIADPAKANRYFQVPGRIITDTSFAGASLSSGVNAISGISEAEIDWPQKFRNMDIAVMDLVTDGSRYGWAGAGAFYLQIARMNALLSIGFNFKPEYKSFPDLFSSSEARAVPDSKCSGFSRMFNRDECSDQTNTKIHNLLRAANDWFVKGAPTQDDTPEYKIAKLINYGSLWLTTLTQDSASNMNVETVGGANDKFSSSANSYASALVPHINPNGDPISELIRLGNIGGITGSVFIALSNLAGFGAEFMGTTVKISLNGLAIILTNIAVLLFMAFIFLSVVIPAMPFVYFGFAVIEWVMSVFEAIVGMPLWALSFLNTEGEGIFGPKAKQGAWMIFEIALRPTIIIFSLVGSILLLKGGVVFFDHLFSAFFEDSHATEWYTSIFYYFFYCFVMYSLAQSVIKLIDVMPNQFMRWIGEQVQGFGGVIDAGAVETQAGEMARFAQSAGQSVGGLGRETGREAKIDADAKAQRTADLDLKDDDQASQSPNVTQDQSSQRTGNTGLGGGTGSAGSTGQPDEEDDDGGDRNIGYNTPDSDEGGRTNRSDDEDDEDDPNGGNII